MSSSEQHPSHKNNNARFVGDYTFPMARSGEEQFGIIKRQRSGISSGEIDFGARDITHLSKGEQQEAINMAYCLYLSLSGQTGLKQTVDRFAKEAQVSGSKVNTGI